MQVGSRRLIAAAVVALAAVLAPNLAQAQGKVTKIIVGFPPGGPIDLVARTISEPMAKDLGNTVIIENRAGGNTLIAAQSVATSAPDGLTIFLASLSTLVLNPLLYEKLPYNADKDFASVSLVVSTPPVLVVHPSNTATDAAVFAAAAKAGADPVPIGSAGIGGTTHISLEMFAATTGAKLVARPLQGRSPRHHRPARQPRARLLWRPAGCDRPHPQRQA